MNIENRQEARLPDISLLKAILFEEIHEIAKLAVLNWPGAGVLIWVLECRLAKVLP